MSNIVQALRRNQYYVIVLAMCLVFVAAHIANTAPGMTASINEDEIHHNFWLLQDKSVGSHFVVSHLQPLLDYALRLYFWFPLFSLPSSLQFLSIVAGLLLAGALGWILKRGISRAERTLRLGTTLLFTNGFVFLAAGLLLYGLLPRSDEGIWLALSWRSWGLLLSVLACGVVLLALAVRLRKYSPWTSKDLQGSLPWTAISLGIYASLGCLALLVIHRPSVFPLRLLAVIERGLPAIVALALLAASVAVLVNSHRTGRSLVLALSVVVFLGFVFVPLGYGVFYSELAIKLPSLFFGILGVLAAFVLPAFYFRERAANHAWALLIAIVCSLWFVFHPFQMAMSGYARHYTLVSLVSLAWFWNFVFGKPGGKWFLLLSFVMINVHFFAIPVVMAAYAFESILLARAGAGRAGLRMLARGAGVILLGLLVNFPVTQQYFLAASDSSSRSLPSAILGGARLWMEYVEFLVYPVISLGANAWESLALPVGVLLALLFSLVLVLGWRRSATQKLVYVLFLVLPLSFIVLARQAGFAFYDRYFAIYIGLGLAFIGLAFEILGDVMVALRARSVGLWPKVYSAVIGLLVLPGVLLGGSDLVSALPKIAQAFDIPNNGSSLYRVYSQLKDLRRPLLLIVNTPTLVQTDIPRFYLDFVDGGSAAEYEIITMSLPTRDAERQVELFLQRNPSAVVVFDWLLTNACDWDQPSQEIRDQIERVQVPRTCVWYMDNAVSYEQVCEAAQALAFPPNSERHFCEGE